MTFESVHDIFVPSGQQWGTRKWNWFSGGALKSTWATTITGSGTITMNDAVDGGVLLTTGTTNNNYSQMDFNDVTHYSNTGSVCISLTKINSTTNRAIKVGLTEQVANSNNTRIIYNDTTSGATHKNLVTTLNTAGTTVASSILINENVILSKVELKTSVGYLWLDGLIEGVSTSNLPDVPLQPHCRFEIKATESAKTAKCFYMEAYNT